MAALHSRATGSLGYFKILSESSVAAGVRRIEAVAGTKAEDYIRETETDLQKVAILLNENKNIDKALEKLIAQNDTLTAKLASLRNNKRRPPKSYYYKTSWRKRAYTIFEQIEAAGNDTVRDLAFELKNEVDHLVLVLAANIEDKPHLAVMIAEPLVESKGLNAGKMVKELAREIKGGGGGQPFFATAGGKDISGLSKVIEKAKQVLM